MELFCYKVIKFLKTEYHSSYDFKIKFNSDLDTKETITLNIIFDNYIKTIENNYMQYIFQLYRQGDFIPERNLYKWQKELVDIIEGS